MQGLAVKKDTSRIIKCPRCGTENITRQDYCGKCGFIFPKSEKDSKKNFGGESSGSGGSSFPGAGGDQSGGGAGGAGQGGGAGAGGGQYGGGSSFPGAGGRSSFPGGAMPVAPDAAENAGEENGEPAEAVQIKTAHHKMDAKSEGAILERGRWMKCPRCYADVKADSVRCMHCGWKMGKK